MKPQYLIPIAMLALAIFLGWITQGGQRLVFLLPMAILNVVAIAAPRMKQVREAPGTERPNMIAEGLYLFVLQLLILGGGYMLGFLFANAVPIIA